MPHEIAKRMKGRPWPEILDAAQVLAYRHGVPALANVGQLGADITELLDALETNPRECLNRSQALLYKASNNKKRQRAARRFLRKQPEPIEPPEFPPDHISTHRVQRQK